MLCRQSRSLLFAALAIAAAMAGLCLPAAAVTELKVAAQTGTEPKFVAVGHGKTQHIEGICIDLLRAIEHLDPELRFTGDQRWMPLVRAVAETSAGTLDLACGLQHTPERDAKFYYIEPSFMTINYQLVVRADDNANITSWDDVRKLAPDNVILVNNGFASIPMLDRLGGLQYDARVPTPDGNLKKLVAGRARFYFHRSPGIAGAIRAAGLTDKLRILPLVMEASKLYLIVGKHVPRETVERIQRSVTQLDGNGELARIVKKWE